MFQLTLLSICFLAHGDCGSSKENQDQAKAIVFTQALVESACTYLEKHKDPHTQIGLHNLQQRPFKKVGTEPPEVLWYDGWKIDLKQRTMSKLFVLPLFTYEFELDYKVIQGSPRVTKAKIAEYRVEPVE